MPIASIFHVSAEKLSTLTVPVIYRQLWDLERAAMRKSNEDNSFAITEIQERRLPSGLSELIGRITRLF
jgi:hypothetical protein